MKRGCQGQKIVPDILFDCMEEDFLMSLILLFLLFLGIDGIMYSGPIADFIAAGVSIGMVYFEFRNINKLENKIEVLE